MASNRRAGFFASQKTRVQGVTNDQTIKGTGGFLHRVIVANLDAALQSLVIKDGASIIATVRVPAGTTIPAEVMVAMGTSIVVNPSNANIDALVCFD
jgi:hypothetical protein